MLAFIFKLGHDRARHTFAEMGQEYDDLEERVENIEGRLTSQ